MDWRRLNLRKIQSNLDSLREQSVTDETWARLREEPLTEDSTRRLFEGYREVDELLAARVDLFAYGESARILELNHIVLCGRTPERRRQYAAHLEATEQRFYDNGWSGVAALMERYGRSRGQAPEMLAADIYTQVVSTPQLFLEGNSRTAGLLASYCLARMGRPPLVVTTRSLHEYHALVERCAALKRDGITGMLRFGMMTRRFAHFLREETSPVFLVPTEPATAAE